MQRRKSNKVRLMLTDVHVHCSTETDRQRFMFHVVHVNCGSVQHPTMHRVRNAGTGSL